MKNFIKSLAVFSLSFLLLFGSCLPLFSARVYAEPIKPVEEVKLYGAGQFISQCIAGKGLRNPATITNLKEGDFINQAGEMQWGLSCKQSEIKKAMGTLNISVAELLISSGVYTLSNDGSTYASNEDKEQAGMNILNALTIKYPEGVNFRGPLSDAAKYFALKSAFLENCSGGKAPNGTDGTSVEIVDDTGGKSTIKFIYKESKDAEVVIGPVYNNNFVDKMKCSDIVTKMNGLATKASETVTSLGGSGGNTSEGADGDYKQSCEERTGLITGWIICGGMELLSSGMDAIMGQVDSLLNVDGSKIENNAKLQLAWGSFRAIASFMLLGVAIVMILAQALGGSN